jgi:chorismate dehydratase
MSDSTWMQTMGRVAFLNCDPLFYGLDSDWNILPAPPAWLTGHLLRKDCILAPIPAADYARHADELILLPDIGICSRGEVGSVLVFGNKPLGQLKSIALPTDSATSVQLLKYLLKKRNLNPEFVLMGPDLEGMLEQCEGALLIGDRALEGAKKFPESVQLDLGQDWLQFTQKPMVFGVFAARKDTPIESLRQAHGVLKDNLDLFEQSDDQRQSVIEWAMTRSHLDYERLDRYFGEVFNRIDEENLAGLNEFLTKACDLESGAQFAW